MARCAWWDWRSGRLLEFNPQRKQLKLRVDEERDNLGNTLMEFVTKIDKEKLEKLLSEYHALDKELIVRIAEARGHGDLRENSDYHAAREDKSMNNLRIRELTLRLESVQVILEGEMPSDMVFLGAIVRIRDEQSGGIETYKIVSSKSEGGETEHREVTTTSPIGEALMKVRVGETVRVNLPRGERRLTVVEILT